MRTNNAAMQPALPDSRPTPEAATVRRSVPAWAQRPLAWVKATWQLRAAVLRAMHGSRLTALYVIFGVMVITILAASLVHPILFYAGMAVFADLFLSYESPERRKRKAAAERAARLARERETPDVIQGMTVGPSIGIEQQRRFVVAVFAWMTIALGLTAATAWYVATSPAFLSSAGSWWVFMGILGAEFVITSQLARARSWIAPFWAFVGLALYAMLQGIVLAVIVARYTQSTIVVAVSISAGLFAVMAAYGFVTRRDLLAKRDLLLMLLLGIALLSLVNAMLGSSVIQWLFSIVMLLLVMALVVLEVGTLRRMSVSLIPNSETEQVESVFGALTLYLDVVLIFVLVLDLMGSDD